MVLLAQRRLEHLRVEVLLAPAGVLQATAGGSGAAVRIVAWTVAVTSPAIGPNMRNAVTSTISAMSNFK